MKDGELFDIPENLSPRERWRRAFVLEFGVSTMHDHTATTRPHHAYTGPWCEYYRKFPMPESESRYAQHARAQTKEAALEELAIKLKHPLAGEEFWA